jgi:hypothetical protein
MTVKQVSEKYALSRALIYLWVDERRFPVLRVGAKGKRGRILIEESDFEPFLLSLRVDAGTVVPSGKLSHIKQ